MRWSRAAGLPGRLPDGLGLALKVKDAGGPDRPLDLLLTSSGSGSLTRHLPLPRTDALAGPYSSLSGYRFPDRVRVVAAFPDEPGRGLPVRPSELAAALARRPTRFRICAAARGEPWRPFAVLSVHPAHPVPAPDTVAFDPYAASLADLPPTDRLRTVREAAYAGSRQGRGAEAPPREGRPTHDAEARDG
ncbi:phosphodiesterase [Streptomyces roseolus]|uniref:phosphodiesterase n=1 Tax=Streptomyces roseolus TaxID=67358 RepID=UPI0036E6ED30